MSPYAYVWNNPVKLTDPDGNCPNCIIGGIIGMAVDYGFQVAGNFASGKKGMAAFTDVDKTSIVLSGLAGAASSGLSAFGGKGTKIIVSTAIDVAESVGKQINSGMKEGKSMSESVTFVQTFSDVVSNKIAGALTKNVGAEQIKTAERQLDRAARVAANDMTSSGRALAVKDAEKNLAKKLGVNKATESVVGNAIQNTSNASRGGNSVEKNQYEFYRTDKSFITKSN